MVLSESDCAASAEKAGDGVERAISRSVDPYCGLYKSGLRESGVGPGLSAWIPSLNVRLTTQDENDSIP